MPDELIGGGVLALRFFVPLLILRYPLPGIVAAILADAFDGAILDGYTSLSLEGYQHFDKAFDSYYLAIAYVAMLRNWTDPTAVAIGRLLLYYRLIGVALFATSSGRYLLFIFPATFEWYFIFYQVVRVRWRTERLTAVHLVTAAGIAWLLKLPQEYWLHISQGSTTEWVKEKVFGMDPSTPRPEVLAANLWIIPVVAAAAAAGALGARRALRVLPPADHPTRFDADVYDPPSDGLVGRPRVVEPVLSSALVEKIALMSLVGIVFAEFLGVHATAVQLTIGVSFLVVANATVSMWLGRQGIPWHSPTAELLTMCAINAPMVFALALLTRWSDASLGASSALFYLVLASLLIGLHDRYRSLRT